MVNRKNIVIAAAVLSFSAAAAITFSMHRSRPELRLSRFSVPDEYSQWDKKMDFGPLPHLVLSHNMETRYIFSSGDCGIINHGYKNRVEIFVVFRPGGIVEQVILGKNVESPDRVEKMRKQRFFDQWNGRSDYADPRHVTGATMTGNAIGKNVKELLRRLKTENFFRQN